MRTRNDKIHTVYTKILGELEFLGLFLLDWVQDGTAYGGDERLGEISIRNRIDYEPIILTTDEVRILARELIDIADSLDNYQKENIDAN